MIPADLHFVFVDNIQGSSYLEDQEEMLQNLSKVSRFQISFQTEIRPNDFYQPLHD